MSQKFLFITGIARGGTSLIGRMIDAHPRISIAIDAYLPVFRSLRNALLARARSNDGFEPTLPLQDGHFSDRQLRWFDAVLAGDLSAPFDAAELPDLKERFRGRASDESGDLLPLIDKLGGATYREFLANALALIPAARPEKHAEWIGVKDLWIVDLFPALARGYPEARFVLILRDPRAIIASIHGYRPIDPSQCAHTLSVLRHWRKAVACGDAFATDPALAGRFLVVRYEDVVRDPEFHGRNICKLMGVDFVPAMLDYDRLEDHATGRKWRGNSTFDDKLTDISTAPTERWRQKLPAETVRFIEFACDVDMRFAGYQPKYDTGELTGDPGILSFLIKDNKEFASWRSDFQDPQQDYGFEAFRRQALRIADDGLDRDTIRRSFLFDAYYRKLSKLAGVKG